MLTQCQTKAPSDVFYFCKTVFTIRKQSKSIPFLPFDSKLLGVADRRFVCRIRFPFPKPHLDFLETLSGEKFAQPKMPENSAPNTTVIEILSGSQTGKRIKIPVGETQVVGRSDAVDVVLPDPSVSRIHCVFCNRNGSVSLSDMESASGTLLNGRPIEEASLSDSLPCQRFHGLADEKPPFAIQPGHYSYSRTRRAMATPSASRTLSIVTRSKTCWKNPITIASMASLRVKPRH